MGMIAFMPWFAVAEDMVVEPFRLVRYGRGEQPFGRGSQQQADVDILLEEYVPRHGGDAVRVCTLLTVEGVEVLRDFSDEQKNSLFELAEIVTLAGLASREFFGLGMSYVNRDSFSFYVRVFEDPASGVGVTSRRRDGSSNDLIPRGTHEFHMPLHVPSFSTVSFDRDMIEALLRAREGDDWPRYSESITGFNRANTDSDQVPERAEAVLMMGAFERLLDCRSGSQRDLVRRFLDRLQPRDDIDIRSCDRIPEDGIRNATLVREFWMRDFYLLRNPLAHGRAERSPVWSLKEHLLLGSYIFPLLVKTLLAADGAYAMTADDQLDVDVFEHLLCARLWDQVDGRWPWNEIYGSYRFNRAIDEA